MKNNKNIYSIHSLGRTWQTQDPFLFSVHHRDIYPKGNGAMQPSEGLDGRQIGQDFSGKDGWSMYHGQKYAGFPYHPHRGFETVSVVEEGLVDHTDSLGTGGRFGEGDVQWMTAGNGIQHSEMFPLLNDDKKNPLELFQIWLNLPKKSKNVPANYKMLWHEDIPVVKFVDNAGGKTEVKVIAGDINDTKALSPTDNSWANDEKNEVAIWIIRMEPNTTWNLPKSLSKVNRSLYFYNGNGVTLDEIDIENYHGVYVNSEHEFVVKSGDEATSLLVLQGKPIGEPVVQYGPFVMNTQLEIQQTMELYQKTEFGGWPWPAREYVFPKEKGRFAKYADGTEDIK